MTRFYADLADILEIPASAVTPDLLLADHGWDSLAIISCVALIDELFGQVISGTALAGCHTVADLAGLFNHAVPA